MKDVDLINEMYANEVLANEIAPALLAVGRAAAPVAKTAAKQAAISGGATLGNRAADKLMGQQPPVQQLQDDSLDDSAEPGKKLTAQNLESVKNSLADGVDMLVENAAVNDKSPLSVMEAYEYIESHAREKLNDLHGDDFGDEDNGQDLRDTWQDTLDRESIGI
jgi:hypothetical protein